MEFLNSGEKDNLSANGNTHPENEPKPIYQDSKMNKMIRFKKNEAK